MEVINQLIANFGVGGTVVGAGIIALLIYSIMKGGGSGSGSSNSGSSASTPPPPPPPPPAAG